MNGQKIGRSVLVLLGWVMGCWVAAPEAYAAHIAGGNLTYEFVGNNAQGEPIYRFTLQLVRDDFDPIGAPFDNQVELTVYDAGTNQLFGSVTRPNGLPTVTAPFFDTIGTGNCFLTPPTAPDYEIGTYVFDDIVLPRNQAGYHVAWARCCRNASVININTPGDFGMTFYTRVPGTTALGANFQNSSPQFQGWAFRVICQGLTTPIPGNLATDPDNDSLAYRLYNPFHSENIAGVGPNNNFPGGAPVGIASGVPPYRPVAFSTPNYNFQQPFGFVPPGVPGTIIDNLDGSLLVTSTNQGRFTYGMVVEEWRNGVLIGQVFRDVQVDVQPCAAIQPPTVTADFTALDTLPTARQLPGILGDTIRAQAQAPFTFDLLFTDAGDAPVLFVDLLLSPGLLDTQEVFRSAGGDSLQVRIFYMPPCTAIGGLDSLLLTFRDDNDCNAVLPQPYRIFFEITPPPVFTLASQLFQAGTPYNGDTLFLVHDGDPLELEVVLETTADGTQGVSYTLALDPLSSSQTQPTLISETRRNDSVIVRFQWPPSCDALSGVTNLVVTSRQSNICEAAAIQRDTVPIIVVPFVNPPPTLQLTNNPGGIVSQDADTLETRLDSLLCFTLRVVDTVNNDQLNQARYRLVNPVTGQVLFGPLAFTTQTDLLTLPPELRGYEASACLQVPCADQQEPLLLIADASDATTCGVENTVSDTLYIRVLQTPNPPPTLTLDLSLTPEATDDTVFITVDSTYGFGFAFVDQVPVTRLAAEVRVESRGTVLTNAIITLDTLRPSLDSLTGTVTHTPGCEGLNDTLLVIVSGLDSFACQESHRITDTVFVVARQLPNPPPTVRLISGAGLELNDGDTLTVVAEDTLCLVAELEDLADSLLGDHFRFEATVLNAAGDTVENAPFGSLLQNSPTFRQEEWCWSAVCSQLNTTLEWRITGIDSNTCTRDHEVVRSIFIRVVSRPLQPLVFSASVFGQPLASGDTVQLPPRFAPCVSLTITDPGNTGPLQLSATGVPFELASADAPATLSDSLSPGGSLSADFCWTPTCAQRQADPYRISFLAVNTPTCADTVVRQDSLFFLVQDAPNAPPVVSITGLPAELEPGQEACFTVEALDPNAFALLSVRGTSSTFDSTYRFGAGIRPQALDTSSLMAPQLTWALCFTPNCYIKQESYPIQFEVLDTTGCDEPLVVPLEREVAITKCFLDVANVFSPNGDGVNDTWGPALLEGIARVEWAVFDRWGTQVFSSNDVADRWDGVDQNGAGSPAGTYFYTVSYGFFSGTGPELKDSFSGSVTLLR